MKFVLLLLAALLPAGSQAASIEASGYAKSLLRSTRSPLTRSYYWSDLNRARLTLDAKATFVRAHVDYDNEWLAGSYLRSADYARVGFGDAPAYWDMEQTLSSGTDVYYRHRLYRGWAELSSGASALRFGRQRIAWGTGKLWNPTDFLNPYSPTALEREERAGVDAAYLRQGLGRLGQAEAVYTLADRWPQSDLLARLRGNAFGTDVSVLGGKTASSTASWAAGGDFAADVLGGSLHGEVLYSDLKTRTPFWKGLIGYDYDFGAAPAFRALKDLWLLVEYHCNGQGESNPARYQPAALLSGRQVSLARDYLGFGLRKELHPLLRLELYAVANLDDGSKFLMPSLDWNALSDLHLSAGWQRFGGGPASEYGRQPNTGYFQAQLFF
ncbi:MAG TPA: hypothetical protein DCM05_08055 [Elusimicrobia bacterium]|nr:hypothetical protein [Elusimicrobiota bacterium]